MVYQVKEVFFTLQGEGAQAGRSAVFCRFSGCNLWSGREEDRATAACTFCDTDFVGTDGSGGGRFTSAQELAHHIDHIWRQTVRASNRELVVFTGGEPLLQLDTPLIEACHALGFQVAIETNGTQPALDGIDWICVSPKPGPPMVLQSGAELKLAFPQANLTPERFEALPFSHFFLVPIDGPQLNENLQAAITYCKAHPQWRLGIQLHKMIGLP